MRVPFCGLQEADSRSIDLNLPYASDLKKSNTKQQSILFNIDLFGRNAKFTDAREMRSIKLVLGKH